MHIKWAWAAGLDWIFVNVYIINVPALRKYRAQVLERGRYRKEIAI